MNLSRLPLLLAAFLLPATPQEAHAVTIDWVTVGDPGNVNDVVVAVNGGGTYGAVPYEYRIGKYEVTIQQYADFLNAVAQSDPYSLYRLNMATDLNIAGISRSGESGSYVHSAIGPFGVTPTGADSRGNRPITYVSWFDAARFANWMSNGQPTGPQGPTTTENGAYALNGATSGIPSPRNTVNPNTGYAPLFVIPTENEWYKAAFYKGGSADAGYWKYGTQSDTAPGNIIGSLSNQANYNNGVYCVTQTTGGFFGVQNVLTNVGTFAGSASAYGTYDQSGNVWEWLEPQQGSSAVLRGGGWVYSGDAISSSARATNGSTIEYYAYGFRLASPVVVPEPSTWVMGLAGIACGGWQMFRRRKRA